MSEENRYEIAVDKTAGRLCVVLARRKFCKIPMNVLVCFSSCLLTMRF